MNRSLSFVRKYWNGVVPDGSMDPEIYLKIENLYRATGSFIEKGAFKDAVNGIFAFVRWANKYFDTETPWITRTSDQDVCQNTLYQCVQIIANLAVLLNPFLPFSSEKIRSWLSLDERWQVHEVQGGYILPEIQILFQRIDQSVVEVEKNRLS